MTRIRGFRVLYCVSAVVLGLGLPAAHAEGITVTKVAWIPESATQSLIRFDIAWDNARRTVGKTDDASYEARDAAWVFVKYYRKDKRPWRHATLAKDGHQEPAGSVRSRCLSLPQHVGETRPDRLERRRLALAASAFVPRRKRSGLRRDKPGRRSGHEHYPPRAGHRDGLRAEGPVLGR